MFACSGDVRCFSKLSSSETHLTLLGRGTETKMNLLSSETRPEPDIVSENPHKKLTPQVTIEMPRVCINIVWRQFAETMNEKSHLDT